MIEDNRMKGPEVRAYLGGISSQTLWRWRRKYGFPEPCRVSSTCNLWRKGDVDNWLSQRHRGAA